MSHAAIRINYRPSRVVRRNDGALVERPEDYEVRLLSYHGNIAGGTDETSHYLASFPTLEQARQYVRANYPDMELSHLAS